MNFVAVIVGLVIVFGLIFVVVFEPFKTVAQPPSEPTDVNLDSEFYFDREPNPLPTYRSVTECQSLSGQHRSDCFTQIAIEQQNDSICNSVQADQIEWCKKDVVVAKGNEDACDALQQPQKNQCHFDFGYNSNSVSSCQKISLAYWRDDCLRYVAQHTLDVRACQSVSDRDVKDDCILNVAVESNSIGLCDEIVDSETKQDCRLAFEPAELPGSPEE